MSDRPRDPSTRADRPSTTPPTGLIIERLKAHAPKTARYQLHGEIARGGMGAILKVWDEDLRRNLAMKVIVGSADAPREGRTPPVSQKLLTRFLEEAQITGQLDHPGIVPVHELGLDSEGRVYFTMKLVKGRELEQILELVFRGEEGWNQTRALGVILKVCEALAYAHDKGVIHRDIKPTNVMVGSFGEVFVMDWGVARVLHQQDTRDLRFQPAAESPVVVTESRTVREGTADSPLLTMDGDIVGTPSYMPPEQARGEIQKLSARSDVYSIGALLYHLLAQQRPYCPPGPKVSSRAVLEHLLRGPPAPLESLRAGIAPELVAICEKAMQREPEERYSDTLALAEDLRSYLEGRVVSAYESGAWAEARKWVRRNKSLAASLAAAFLLLIGGTVAVAVVQARGRKAAQESRNAALAELSARKSVLEFLTAVIDASDPEASGNQTGWTLEEVVDRSTQRVQDDLREFPEVRAELLKSLARIQQKLGRPAEAFKLGKEAVDLARASYGPEDPRTAAVERLWADDLIVVGECEQALQLLRHSREVIGAHPGETRIAIWQIDLDIATSLTLLHRYDEALPILEALDNGPELSLPENGHERVTWMRTRAETQKGLGQNEQAEATLRAAIALSEQVWGRKHVNVAGVLQNLAALHIDTGRVEEALPELLEARAIREEVGAKPSIEDARLSYNLGTAHNKRGELAEALADFQRALELTRRFAGDSAQSARAGTGVGAILFKLDRSDEAEPYLRQALELSRRFIARKGLAAVEAPMWLARTRAKQGHPEEAAELWKEVFTCLEGDVSVPPALLAKYELDYATVLEALGRTEEAAEHRERAKSPDQR